MYISIKTKKILIFSRKMRKIQSTKETEWRAWCTAEAFYLNEKLD